MGTFHTAYACYKYAHFWQSFLANNFADFQYSVGQKIKSSSSLCLHFLTATSAIGRHWIGSNKEVKRGTCPSHHFPLTQWSYCTSVCFHFSGLANNREDYESQFIESQWKHAVSHMKMPAVQDSASSLISCCMRSLLEFISPTHICYRAINAWR